MSAITPIRKSSATNSGGAITKKSKPRNPDTYSVPGYAAMTVLAEGVKKANMFDTAVAGRDSLARLHHAGRQGQL